jgi:hypothetical protein
VSEVTCIPDGTRLGWTVGDLWRQPRFVFDVRLAAEN